MTEHCLVLKSSPANSGQTTRSCILLRASLVSGHLQIYQLLQLQKQHIMSQSPTEFRTKRSKPKDLSNRDGTRFVGFVGLLVHCKSICWFGGIMSVHCKKKTPGEAQNPGALGGLAHCGLAIDHRIPAEQPGLEERLTRAIDPQRRRVEEASGGTKCWNCHMEP